MSSRTLFLTVALCSLAACADPKAATQPSGSGAGSPSVAAGSSDGAASCDALPSGVVATADGITVTGPEVEKATNGQVFQLRQQIYQARSGWASNEVAKRLLEREAHKVDPNMDFQAFLDKQVDSKVKPVSDIDAQMFFKQNQAQMQGKSFDDVKDQIKQYLSRESRQSAQNAYVQKLMDDNHFKLTMNAPEPPVVDVAAADNPAKGPENAPVTIIEFSDFQCPACRQAESKLPDLLKQYDGKVRFVYRDYPLTKHQDAFGAALAANCALQQGKYWEMHDLLFSSQTQGLKEDNLKTYAESLKLDMSKFDACRKDPKVSEEVHKDMQAGDDAGVNATPTFFVNGRMISGSNMQELSRLIDSELKKKNAS